MLRKISKRVFAVGSLPILSEGYPDLSEPSSMVVGSNFTWQDEVMLVPHEAFRMYMSWMKEAVDGIDGKLNGEEWKVNRFVAWFKEWFAPILHHHHDAEEKILFPFLREKNPDWPEKISSDHAQLMEDINRVLQIEKILKDLSEGPEKAAAVVTELKSAIYQLINNTTPHLQEEEELVPQKIKQSDLSEEELNQVVGRIIQSGSLKGNSKFLPAIVYAMYSWGGDEAVARFRANMPALIKFLLDNSWEPAWRSNSLLVLDAIIKGEDPGADACRCLVM